MSIIAEIKAVGETSQPDVRLLRSITLNNILSFGPETPPLELRALNVLIGPNGSGKSNLLDCIGLLQSAPDKLADTIRTEGSIQEWLWKGSKNPIARVETVVTPLNHSMGIRHSFSFREAALRFELVDERIEAEKATAKSAKNKPFLFFGYENGKPTINVQREKTLKNTNEMLPGVGMMHVNVTTFKRELQRQDIDPEMSILAQRKDPDQYPELTYLGRKYRQIRLYREWTFGRSNPARDWQDTAGPNDFLTDSADNLALMLNRFQNDPEVAPRIVELMNELYDGISNFNVQVFGGRMQVRLTENKFSIPASRLSDGTLRFLSLLAILLHPTPPPLICLEEPELGLHADVVVAVGKLIKEASTRTQLIVTTHSQVLIDTLSASPEDVIVCGKEDGATVMKRLDADKLQHYLEEYTLGTLWSSGDIGGNRW
jgi:predicted ATPase